MKFITLQVNAEENQQQPKKKTKILPRVRLSIN